MTFSRRGEGEKSEASLHSPERSLPARKEPGRRARCPQGG